MKFYKLLYVLCFFLISYVETGKKFKIKLVKAGKCEIPADKADPSPPVTFTDVYVKKVDRDVTLINANFSITKKYGPVVIGCRGYQIKENSARDLIFKLEKISCHNPISYNFIKMANLHFDKNCFFETGQYKIENLNIQTFEWILTKSAVTPGRYIYELEFSSPKGVTSCIYTISDITIA